MRGIAIGIWTLAALSVAQTNDLPHLAYANAEVDQAARREIRLIAMTAYAKASASGITSIVSTIIQDGFVLASDEDGLGKKGDRIAEVQVLTGAGDLTQGLLFVNIDTKNTRIVCPEQKTPKPHDLRGEVKRIQFSDVVHKEVASKNWFNIAFGIVCFLYSVYLLILRRTAPEELKQLALMQKLWGVKAGAFIHFLCILLSLLAGIWFMTGDLFGNNRIVCLCVGIVSILFCIYSWIVQFRAPEELDGLEDMKDFWGEKTGVVVHVILCLLFTIVSICLVIAGIIGFD